jgi:hypothetical protein
MIDDYSRFTEVYFLKFKSEVSKFINEYIKYAENKFEKKVKVITSDNGREYITKELQRSLTEMGIKVQYTAPYSAFQNGVAERKNRTLMEAARCMLIDAEMKKKYWAEAVNTACYRQNILPSKAVDKTPFEVWNRRKPDVKHLHIFGCKGYALLPKEKRRKLDEKAILLTFVGYSAESKAYRMLDTATDKITISRDVKIIERDLKREEENEKGSSQENKSTERRKIVENRDENTPESGQEVNCSEDIEIISENELENEQEKGLNESSESLNEFEEAQSLAQDSVLEQSLPAGDEEYVFQGNLDDLNNQEVSVSERQTKGQPPDRFKPQANIVRDHEEPKNRMEALSGVDKHDWIRAMNDEMKALTENSTWVLWIRRLFEDFHIEQTKPIRIYEDNQSAIKLIKTGESRNKTKHIDVKYHFVTDLKKKKIIEIRYCPTAEMIAKMMTKSLGAVKLKKHRETCQLVDLKRSIS